MARDGCQVTCYNRSGHHVSGAEYDDKIEYGGIRQKFVPTIERKGLAAVSSSFFAALYSAFGKYDVVHIHAEGPAFFAWLPKLFGKRVVVTIHGGYCLLKDTEQLLANDADMSENLMLIFMNMKGEARTAGNRQHRRYTSLIQFKSPILSPSHRPFSLHPPTISHFAIFKLQNVRKK